MTPSEADYARAVELLQAGELVAFPTETVYGLGADAANPEAVAKIFAAKGRPADHPLIVHLAGHDAVDHWAEQVPAVAWELMETFWPGPLTLILKKQSWVPDAVTGGQDTVGLRVPGHPVALELLRRFAAVTGEHAGIAAPSANRFGRISPTTAAHVLEELGDRTSLILDGGPCKVGIESTIVDCSRDEPAILRPGHILPDHLAAVFGRQVAIQTATGAPRVSGSLAHITHRRRRCVSSPIHACWIFSTPSATRAIVAASSATARRRNPECRTSGACCRQTRSATHTTCTPHYGNWIMPGSA